jgi:hypothetical protein
MAVNLAMEHRLSSATLQRNENPASGFSRDLKVGLTVFGAMFTFSPKDIQGGFYGLGQMGTIRRIEQNSKSHQ